MAIEPTTFRYEADSETGVATVTLDRPERLNALTFDVYAELRDAFGAIGDEPGVRAVVITGAGKAFCSGGDVEDIIGALFERDHEGLYEFTRTTCDLILAIRRCPRPVVAALNGTVAGAGAVIAAACDVRIAADTAKIAFLFTKVGLSGADMGAAWLLPRIVGHGLATGILMTGEFVSPEEALRIGLYNRVVPVDEVLPEALDLAGRLAKGPARSLEATKRALDDEWAMGLEAALENEARVQAERMTEPDFREAYEAWRERRAPAFDGSPDPGDGP